MISNYQNLVSQISQYKHTELGWIMQTKNIFCHNQVPFSILFNESLSNVIHRSNISKTIFDGALILLTLIDTSDFKDFIYQKLLSYVICCGNNSNRIVHICVHIYHRFIQARSGDTIPHIHLKHQLRTCDLEVQAVKYGPPLSTL